MSVLALASLTIALVSCGGGAARTAPAPAAAPAATPTSPDAPPAFDAIVESELRADLFAMAGDSMRGREAGTLDELRASGWLVERLRAAGLEPAGEDGSYFQWWAMRRTVTSRASRVRIGARDVKLFDDAYVVGQVNASLSGPVVWVGTGTAAELSGRDLSGKIVAVQMTAPRNPPRADVSLRAYRYTLSAIGGLTRELVGRGAAAVLIVSDSVAEPELHGFGAAVQERGRYALDSGAVQNLAGSSPPILWMSRAYLDELRRTPAPTVSMTLDYDSYLYPSVNVVAKVRGTDPALRDEFVVFSSHQDHDGVRNPVGGDSIYNGADDNASQSVAILAIGRAFAKHPGRRSALFVWQGAEERGLIGSRYFVWKPTVPRASMVAVINGDLVGGNAPDSAALLGVQPPHLNSGDLARMALQANDRFTHFVIDSSWDRPTHPEGWYFRSDHLSYARRGIPAIMFTTLLHPRYHAPTDEPSAINYPKLTKMTRWMYATGWAVANTTERPRVEPGFKLER